MIVAVGNNGQFYALCRVLGQAHWAEDERFRTNALHVANRAALREVLSPMLADRHRAELLLAFEEAGVPCGPINDMADVFEDPQSMRSPLRFSGTPVQHRASPMLGEHNAQVLADELGLGEERLRSLRERAVI